jgi:hypothetical protein
MRRNCVLFLLLALCLAPIAAFAADPPVRPQVAEAAARPSEPVPTRPTAPALRASLATILAKPEYAPAQATWLQKLQDLFRRAAMWVIQRLHGGAAFGRLWDTNPILYWTIVASLLIVLAAILYHIYRGLQQVFGPRRARPRKSGELPPAVTASPRTLRDMAEAAAREGDFDQALRHLYMAVLRHFDRIGLLPYQRARTNWEYVDALRGKADLVADFQPLTLAVDRVIYGRVSADAAAYQTCTGLVDRLWDRAKTGAAGG